MEKRYQVFVSSTYEDLLDERREVMQALLKMDCIPTGMELFPAADDDSLTLIKRFIAECDYYVVIVGGRYGSIGPDGRSYTEVEYDLACEAGIPILPFLHGEPSAIPVGKAEGTDQGKAALSAFRKKIEAKRHADYWTSPKDLSGSVCLALMSLMKIKPRVGWVRGDRVPYESAAQEILKLRNEVAELQQALTGLSSTAPAGTESLAQGDESISLRFSFQVPTQNDTLEAPLEMTWNELLALLGPIMLDRANEQEMKNKLAEALKNRVRDQKKWQAYGVSIRDEDFQKAKLQLRALGLITKAEGKGIYPYWTLTPYGDTLLTQTAAIRSAKAESTGPKTPPG